MTAAEMLRFLGIPNEKHFTAILRFITQGVKEIWNSKKTETIFRHEIQSPQKLKLIFGCAK